VSDESQGPGWWLASDGKWYPPELAPGAQPPPGGPPPGGPPPYTPPGGSYGTGPMGVSFSGGDAFGYGWRKYTSNLGPVLIIVLIPIAVSIVLQVIAQNAISTGFGRLLFLIVSDVVQLMLSIGIYNAALMLTRGETPDVGRCFSTENWGGWIAFAFLWGLMILVGAVFCLVGAFIVIGIWGLAPYYFLDRHLSFGEALHASSEATGSNPGLRVALALTALFGLLGVIACGIGILATLPAAYIGGAYLYRGANREPVAA
jgi:hypothetical protein